MRVNRLLFYVLLAWCGNLIGAGRDGQIGLTYKVKPVRCGEISKAQSCAMPDPRGALFFVNLGKLGGGGYVDGEYRNSLRLSVFVAGDYTGAPPRAMSNNELEDLNIILGASSNVRLFAGNPSRDFDSFLQDGIRYASGGRVEEYAESALGSVRVVDSLGCKGVKPKDLIPSETPRHLKCYSQSVVRRNIDHDWAYTVCPRKYIGNTGNISAPVCQVWSRVKTGVYTEYQINGGMVEDGSWVDLDKRVRNYILSIEAKEGGK